MNKPALKTTYIAIIAVLVITTIVALVLTLPNLLNKSSQQSSSSSQELAEKLAEVTVVKSTTNPKEYTILLKSSADIFTFDLYTNLMRKDVESVTLQNQDYIQDDLTTQMSSEDTTPFTISAGMYRSQSIGEETPIFKVVLKEDVEFKLEKTSTVYNSKLEQVKSNISYR